MGATSSEDRAISVLVAEYQYVSGLIPFYRNVEMLVLAGTGLVSSGAGAAAAALTGGENPNPSVAAGVLVAAAFGPALLLVVEITALTRIARASNYIREHLVPLARRLTDEDEILHFENAPTDLLLEGVSESQKVYRGLVGAFASSLGVLLIPVLTTIALTVGALSFDASGPVWVFGIAACAIALAGTWYGWLFTSGHERRRAKRRSDQSALRV